MIGKPNLLADISLLKNGRVKAIRLSTLEMICKVLDCQHGDLLEYKIAKTRSQIETFTAGTRQFFFYQGLLFQIKPAT